MQFFLTAFTSLQGLLQNCINFSLSSRWKAKIAENDVLLQEWLPIAAEIAQIPVLTQDSHCLIHLPPRYLSA